MDDQELIAYLRRRLKVIQDGHNFDPKSGAKQVRQLGNVDAFAYGQFKELRDLVRKFRLPVAVMTRDPSGKVSAQAVQVPSVDAYFARKDGTTRWKIGSSIDAAGRVKAVATGNDGVLGLVHVVTGIDGRDVERKLKWRLRRWKTRDRNHTHKGEWFDLSPTYVESLVQYLQAGGKPEESALP